MNRLLKLISLALIFFIAFLIFLPKEAIYNMFERELSKHKIIVSKEIKKEKPFGLVIETGDVYFDGINAALLKEMDFNTYLISTYIKIDTLRISKEFENILPSKIDTININHSIFSFNKLDLNAFGDFGEFTAEVLLFEQKIVGELKPSNIMKSKYRKVLQQFKLEEGKYKYEFKF